MGCEERGPIMMVFPDGGSRGRWREEEDERERRKKMEDGGVGSEKVVVLKYGGEEEGLGLWIAKRGGGVEWVEGER